MKAHLLIQPKPDGSFVVKLVNADGVLARADHLMDAQRIARNLSSWTHLPIYEATHG